MKSVLIVEMVLYFLLIIGVGLFFSKKKMNRSEFLLGGKNFRAGRLPFLNGQQVNRPGCY